jgi:HK97 family phage major capsid protein
MKLNRLTKGFLWLFTILIAAALFVFGTSTAGKGGIVATACFMPMAFVRRQDSNPDDLGGGATLTPAQFQERALGAIGKVRDQQKTITDNFDKLDKESKKLAEDFSGHVKGFEGLPNQIVDIQRSIASIQLKIATERRSMFGSGLDLISADPELRNVINGIAREAAARINGGSIKITDDQKKGAQDWRDAMAAKALSDGASPGSTYINAQLLPAIYSTIAEYGIWNKFDVMPVSTSSAKLIVDSTDPLMYWQSTENTAVTEGAPTGTQLTATINKLLGWIQVSRELLEDAEIDLTSHLLRKFANAAAYGLDWACLQADGGADSTDGGFTGIFGGSGTAAVAASGNVSVATLDFEDFLTAMLAVDAAVLSRPTTCWIIHPQMLVRTLAIKDLNGRPIFLPSIDAPAPGAIGSILGYPVILAHGANATDGVSKKIAVFGDRMGQAVCLRRDFEWASSDQAKFTEDSIVFRARVRAAAKTKKATAFGVLTTAAS